MGGYYTARGISTESLGIGMPEVKGADPSIATDSAAIETRAQNGKGVLHKELDTRPGQKHLDPSAAVNNALQTDPRVIKTAEVDRRIEVDRRKIEYGKSGIEARGQEIKRPKPEFNGGTNNTMD